ncbi:MAG: hypothetical protein IJ475_03305 [Bacilli bacterium]|nr:hypothetical protein [Bacilli bacterium]
MKNILKIEISDNTYLLFLVAMLAGYFKSVFLIMIVVFIHEFGHVFFFKLFKIEIVKISLYPFGGITLINKKIHERIYKDVICCLGGIFFQILFFFFVHFVYIKGYLTFNTYELLKLYNYTIIVFNLIPMVPLDGSKLLFAVCTKFFSFKKSYLIMCICSFVSLILFIIYNMVFKLNDIILYLFLGFMLIKTIKEFKYVMNKFYLERVLYDHYYDGIVNNDIDIDCFRIDKYYYFKDGKGLKNEKKYLLEKYFN